MCLEMSKCGTSQKKKALNICHREWQVTVPLRCYGRPARTPFRCTHRHWGRHLFVNWGPGDRTIEFFSAYPRVQTYRIFACEFSRADAQGYLRTLQNFEKPPNVRHSPNTVTKRRCDSLPRPCTALRPSPAHSSPARGCEQALGLAAMIPEPSRWARVIVLDRTVCLRCRSQRLWLGDA